MSDEASRTHVACPDAAPHRSHEWLDYSGFEPRVRACPGVTAATARTTVSAARVDAALEAMGWEIRRGPELFGEGDLYEFLRLIGVDVEQ